jgi:malate dehydrogenase
VSPAWAALEMVEAIVFNKRKIMPACVLLEGEYGVNGLFVGVPVILGRNGVESVVVLDLAEAERAAFERSAAAVPKTMDEVTTVKQAPH